MERRYGRQARSEVLAAVPRDLAETYASDGYNALVWYDLEVTDTFLEAAAALLMRGDVGPWRGLAREHFETDLASVLRPARSTDPAALLKRSAAGWSRLFDFGGLRVGEAQGSRVTVRVDGFEGASLALRYVMLGTLEAMVRSSGASDPSGRILLGEGSFARDFECELSWAR